jgi:hypothetical protein
MDERRAGCDRRAQRMSDSSISLHAVATQLALMEKDIKAVKKVAEDVHSLLQDDRTGPGLMTRLDRMEQESKRSRWYHGVWFVASIGILVSWIASKLGINS